MSKPLVEAKCPDCGAVFGASASRRGRSTSCSNPECRKPVLVTKDARDYDPLARPAAVVFTTRPQPVKEPVAEKEVPAVAA